MAQLIVRNLDQELVQRLKIRAAQKGRSMEAEHREIERCIKGVASGGEDTPALVRTFIEVLQQHIGKEINVLFPIAEQKISSQELEQMAGRCVEHYHRKAGVPT